MLACLPDPPAALPGGRLSLEILDQRGHFNRCAAAIYADRQR